MPKNGFEVHNAGTAPERAKPVLEGVQKKYGFIPNLMAVMSESPAAAKAYATLNGVFEETAFDPAERQIVLMTANAENGCTYCMAAHSVIAEKQGVPAEVIEALRSEAPQPDAKHEALRKFTLAVLRQRGWVSEEQVDAFLAAGYERRHVLDVIVGLALKTISNYTNHVAETPVDPAFQARAWSKGTARAA